MRRVSRGRSALSGAALLGLALVAGATVARAQGSPPASAALRQSEGEAFHARLVRAIAANDRRQVAGLFRYPFRVNAASIGREIPVRDAAALLQMYDLFFTPDMRCALEQSRTVQPGRPRPPFILLVADGVVTMADGRLVAEQTPAGYRVTRMTPIGAPASGSKKPQNVVFRSVRGETQFGGRLARDEVDAYTVPARRGDFLEARIERFPGRALALKVVQQGTGRVVVGTSNEFARTWAAPVPEDGDYRVEVQRRSAYCGPEVTYLLTLVRR